MRRKVERGREVVLMGVIEMEERREGEREPKIDWEKDVERWMDERRGVCVDNSFEGWQFLFLIALCLQRIGSRRRQVPDRGAKVYLLARLGCHISLQCECFWS